MNKKLKTIDGVERSRWAVAAGAAVLLWSSWNYCAGEDIGLFVVTAVLTALAFISKHSLPRRARWVIWAWVIVSVICLAANVNRIMPVQDNPGRGFIFDRVATAVYALGLCAVLFLSGRLQVSLIAIGSMPVVMLAFRERDGMPLNSGHEQIIVWVFVALLVLLDYACRSTRPAELGRGMSITIKKGGTRWLFLLLTVCGAFFMRHPVESASFGLQRLAYGMVYGGHPRRRSPMNTVNGLYLSRSLPDGYRERMRMLLLIDSDRVPGYLRENVFTEYRNGKWLKPENEGEPLPAVNAALNEEDEERTFMLAEESMHQVIDDWSIEVMNPKMLSALCLPGSVISISSYDPAPFVNSDGVVTVEPEYASRYRAGIGDSHKFMTVCQRTDGFSDPAYLDVPPKLSGAVSNWVADCAGLGGDVSALESRINLRKYFYSNFRYNSSVRINRRPDPIIDFMKRREGICIHFASAAALMFRSAGIPSRVVVGYVCMEWNPWIKRYVIREREGHAWVEIWDDEHKQWLLVEPTPPAGIPMNKEQSGVMRLTKDVFVASWKRFVAWIRNINLLQTIAAAGSAVLLYIMRLASSPPGIALVIALALFVWWHRRKARLILTEEEQLRAELTAMMYKIAHRGLSEQYHIQKAECWDSWLKRVEEHLPADTYAELSETVESYQLLRYSRKLDISAARKWLAAEKTACQN
ncbi:MAG: transglutaminase family protein [Kiritimatiellia bacterium]